MLSAARLKWERFLLKGPSSFVGAACHQSLPQRTRHSTHSHLRKFISGRKDHGEATIQNLKNEIKRFGWRDCLPHSRRFLSPVPGFGGTFCVKLCMSMSVCSNCCSSFLRSKKKRTHILGSHLVSALDEDLNLACERCTAAAHCSAQEEKSNAADKDHSTWKWKCRKQGVLYVETGSAEVADVLLANSITVIASDILLVL